MADDLSVVSSQPLPDLSVVESKPLAQQSRTWMDSATDFGREFFGKLNPVSAAKGLYQTATHPVEAYQADAAAREKLRQTAEEAFENGAKEKDPLKKANHYANGVTYALQGILPVIGPALQGPAEQLEQGHIAAGLGSAAGLGTSISPEMVKLPGKLIPGKAALASKAEGIYQSALKPSTGYDLAEQAQMNKTGLNNAIPISPDGVQKLTDLVSDLNKKVKAKIQAGSQAGTTLNPQAIASRTDALKGKFATQVNPEADLAAIDSSKAEFLRNWGKAPIPAGTAQDLKVGTYQQLRGKYGELSSASTEAQKALARGIKEELQKKFPEIGDWNASEGKLLNLQGALEQAVKRNANHNLMGIGTPIAAGAVGAATGSLTLATVAGALKAIVEDPIFKSKFAIALNRAAKTGTPLSQGQARLGAYLNALGNATSSQETAGQTNGQ